MPIISPKAVMRRGHNNFLTLQVHPDGHIGPGLSVAFQIGYTRGLFLTCLRCGCWIIGKFEGQGLIEGVVDGEANIINRYIAAVDIVPFWSVRNRRDGQGILFFESASRYDNDNFVFVFYSLLLSGGM